jgi:hypothetical protein
MFARFLFFLNIFCLFATKKKLHDSDVFRVKSIIQWQVDFK